MKAFSFVTAVSAVFALTACALEPAGNRASIGATGGTLSVSQGALRGASINVPPGALASAVTITMSEGAAPTMLAESVESAGGVLVMGPEGQTFATPVTLTIPTTSAATDVLTRPLGGSEWTVVEGATFDAARNVMVARVSHFSEFVPVRRRVCAADASCPAGQRCVAGFCARGSSPDAGVVDASPACRADSDCAAGQRCASGVCVAGGACPAGQTACGGACVDLATDARNCGACGSACAAGQTCTAGVCRAASSCVPSPERCNGLDDDCDGLVDESDPMSPLCGAGQTCRSGSCVASGACRADSDCAAGQRCASGVCVAGGACPAGQTACGGACVDLATDARNCGACGSACAAGQTCTAGVCAAGASDAGVDSGAACRADSECPAGQRCASGACVAGGACPAGQIACGGACVNLATDVRNCGACGSACAAGQTCSAGACR